VWVAHRKLFKAGNISLSKYFRKMNVKFKKAVHRLYNGKTFSDMPILTINHPV
jgi:protein gp37